MQNPLSSIFTAAKRRIHYICFVLREELGEPLSMRIKNMIAEEAKKNGESYAELEAAYSRSKYSDCSNIANFSWETYSAIDADRLRNENNYMSPEEIILSRLNLFFDEHRKLRQSGSTLESPEK